MALDAENRVPDGEGFDPSLVPEGPLSDFFYDGRDGHGLSNAEWDVMRARMKAHGNDPFDNPTEETT